MLASKPVFGLRVEESDPNGYAVIAADYKLPSGRSLGATVVRDPQKNIEVYVEPGVEAANVDTFTRVSRFTSVVSELALLWKANAEMEPEKIYKSVICSGCGTVPLYEQRDTAGFLERIGCLDCNVWTSPLRLTGK